MKFSDLHDFDGLVALGPTPLELEVDTPLLISSYSRTSTRLNSQGYEDTENLTPHLRAAKNEYLGSL